MTLESRDALSQHHPVRAPAASVVLVEDDASASSLLRSLLEQSGYHVAAAESIAGASELLRTQPWDVLILDRGLPDGDGLDLCRRLREAAPQSSGYILILSGVSSEAAKVESFDQGADDYVTKPFQLPELMARIRAGLRIVSLQKQLLTANERLEHLSNTDALTGLPNKRALDEQLQREFDECRRYDRPMSLVMIDVDRFKAFNDTYGHSAGDSVLRHVAARMATISRKSDFVARFGGEEFVAILPETSLEEAVQFAEKLRLAIASPPLSINGSPLGVTISLGVASIPHSRFETPDALVRAADQALYRAKKNGRNRVDVERRRERAVGASSFVTSGRSAAASA
jgi:two-component system cell cycle response regulator